MQVTKVEAFSIVKGENLLGYSSYNAFFKHAVKSYGTSE